MAELLSIREMLNELVTSPIMNTVEGKSKSSEKEKQEISTLQQSLKQKQSETAALSNYDSNSPADMNAI